jgi:hypothetical protein
MYDPRLGRFTQTDPILGNRPSQHYAYAGNNPLSFIDPMGEDITTWDDKSSWLGMRETLSVRPKFGDAEKNIYTDLKRLYGQFKPGETPDIFLQKQILDRRKSLYEAYQGDSTRLSNYGTFAMADLNARLMMGPIAAMGMGVGPAGKLTSTPATAELPIVSNMGRALPAAAVEAATARTLKELDELAPFMESLRREAGGIPQGQMAQAGVVGMAGPLPMVTKAVNSDIIHAVERAVERGVMKDPKAAGEALRELSKTITQARSFPAGSVIDPLRSDSVKVPFGEGGWAIYEVTKKATAILRTVIQ